MKKSTQSVGVGRWLWRRMAAALALSMAAMPLAPQAHAQLAPTADERRVMTLDALSAHGLLAEGGPYFERLVREPNFDAYQVLYQARERKGSLLIFSKAFVVAHGSRAMASGFLLAHTPSFLNIVRSEWGLSTDGAPTAIDEPSIDGTVYELSHGREPWGFLFAGRMSSYPVYVVVAKVSGLDRALFLGMLREHARKLQALPPSSEPSNVPMQRRRITLGALAISVMTPGDLRELPAVALPAPEGPITASLAYAYVGRFPLDLSIGWTRLREGPVNLRGAAEGSLAAIARMPGVNGLESKIEATKVSGLEGFRGSATFMASGQAMVYESIVFVRGLDVWNVSVVVPVSDVKARQAALEFVGSIQLETTKSP